MNWKFWRQKKINLDDLTLEELERETRRNKFFVISMLLFVLSVYLFYFGVKLGLPLTKDPNVFGTFGDFVGGVLNPVVALFAFFWLSKSVLIQKLELSETKRALQDSSKEQAKQAKLMYSTTLLTSLNTQINSVIEEIKLHRTYLQHLISQDRSSLGSDTTSRIITIDGSLISTKQELSDKINQMNGYIVGLVKDRNKLIREVKSIQDTTETYQKWEQLANDEETATPDPEIPDNKN